MAEQVGKFLTELPELETPTDGDLMYIVDDETTSKKVTMANLKRVLGGNVTGTVEGASVSFSDGADGIPMEECEVTIVPTQDLHGYSKPWAGGAGKNKYPDTQDINLGGTNPRTVTNAISVPIGAGTYCISWKSTGEATSNLQMRIDGVNTGLNSGSSFTVTSSANQCYWFITTADYDANKIAHIYDIQIESSSTPSGYEPYSNICPISGHTDVTITVASTSGGSGDDTTVSLGRTVYGGTLDVTTGELVVNKASSDLGDLSWVKSAEGRFQSTSLNGIIAANTGAEMPNMECSVYEVYRAGAGTTIGITAFTEGGTSYIRCIDSSYADATSFTNGVRGQTICYELATPQTFTLTKEQIITLLGQNYVRHDGGGNIKAVYIRDLDIVINDLINRVTALENE